MLLFTWNVAKKEEAVREALFYLRRSGFSFLACLQELPGAWSSTDRARDSTERLMGNSVRCLGVTPAAEPQGHGRVAIFCSPNIRSNAQDVQSDPRQRMAVITVLGGRVEPLLVIGYHGESRQSAPTEHDRGRIGAQARGQVDNHWHQDPMVMLGDFNASPFDAEVCGSDGLFALRDRTETARPRASSLVSLGTRQRPLYNPMWSLLPEDQKRPPGTLVHAPNLMLRWRLYDQILVSADLIRHLRSPPEILSQINGRSLLNAHGNPCDDLSDHLPVQIRVTL